MEKVDGFLAKKVDKKVEKVGKKWKIIPLKHGKVNHTLMKKFECMSMDHFDLALKLNFISISK